MRNWLKISLVVELMIYMVPYGADTEFLFNLFNFWISWFFSITGVVPLDLYDYADTLVMYPICFTIPRMVTVPVGY
jgi:hypothetical protein